MGDARDGAAASDEIFDAVAAGVVVDWVRRSRALRLNILRLHRHVAVFLYIQLAQIVVIEGRNAVPTTTLPIPLLMIHCSQRANQNLRRTHDFGVVHGVGVARRSGGWRLLLWLWLRLNYRPIYLEVGVVNRPIARGPTIVRHL